MSLGTPSVTGHPLCRVGRWCHSEKLGKSKSVQKNKHWGRECQVQLISKVLVPSIKKCLYGLQTDSKYSVQQGLFSMRKVSSTLRYIWEHLGPHTSELTLTCYDELHSSLKNANFSLCYFFKAVLKPISSLNKAAIQVYHPTRHLTGKLNSTPDTFFKTYLG